VAGSAEGCLTIAGGGLSKPAFQAKWRIGKLTSILPAPHKATEFSDMRPGIGFLVGEEL
jgi:hypothetical protein